MARKRMYNTVRTDSLEERMAYHEARGDYNAYDALDWLARDVGAPIDYDEIEKTVESHRVLYRHWEHWEHGGKTLDDISKCAICNPGVEK